jgi:hypothetical protein
MTVREPGDCVIVHGDTDLYAVPCNQTVKRKVWFFTRQCWSEWQVCDASAANPGDLICWELPNGSRRAGEVQ